MNDVVLSLPSVINRRSIAKTLDLPHSFDEETALERSAQIIHDAIEQLDLDDRISTGLIPSTRFMFQHKAVARIFLDMMIWENYLKKMHCTYWTSA